MCELVTEAGADYIKTSTGFVKNGVGAKVEDVKIMSDIANKYGILVKASGGIKTFEDAKKAYLKVLELRRGNNMKYYGIYNTKLKESNCYYNNGKEVCNGVRRRYHFQQSNHLR